MRPPNMLETSMIDAFPVYNCGNTVLDIGCGEGRIDFQLTEMGYQVWGVDLSRYDIWGDFKSPVFCVRDIFDLSSMPIQEPDIVICSEMLEHVGAWRMALVNMMALAKVRIIITVPFRRSFGLPPIHRHFWDDKESKKFMDVNEFKRICHPNSVSISKIRTKPEDAGKKEHCYLIIIDKRQNILGEGIQ